MTKKRALVWICGAVLCLSVIVSLYCFWRFPPDPLDVTCHNIFDAGIPLWIEDSKTNIYPNVEGDSVMSFIVLLKHIFSQGERWVTTVPKNYGYIPGLEADDPTELILIYLKKRTRRTWHGDRSNTIFTERKWMVIPPDLTNGGNPEIGTLLDTAEFQRRLVTTLDFLKKNNRPHWQKVVKEHTAFLNSIKE